MLHCGSGVDMGRGGEILAGEGIYLFTDMDIWVQLQVQLSLSVGCALF